MEGIPSQETIDFNYNLFLQDLWRKGKNGKIGHGTNQKSNNVKRIASFLLITCLTTTVAFEGCNEPYKAGNLVSLDYPIKTALRSSLIQEYCDTLINNYAHQVPEKWLHENKLVEFDSLNHKRIYFRNSPEEMYLISWWDVSLERCL